LKAIVPARQFRHKKGTSFPSLLWAAICYLACGLAQAAGSYPFSISAEKSGNAHELIARNKGPAPVSLRLSLNSAENVADDIHWPIFVVIRPQSEFTVASISAMNKSKGHRFTTQASYRLGNFHAIHDARSLYRIPFEDGRTFIISQAANGPLSTHNSKGNENAIDFTMPENTPIVAARDGIVIDTEGRNEAGGKDPALLKLANHIRILHEDETIATYAHLSPNSIKVKIGQKVTAGMLIGLSGSTGYSSGPHLHFAVHQLQRDGDQFVSTTVPIRFYVGNPAYIFAPEYLQVITTDYINPGKPPVFAKRKRAEEARLP
jgi:murein DD-endopeptidase MepM/ murein hydrolase activator NlpD